MLQLFLTMRWSLSQYRQGALSSSVAHWHSHHEKTRSKKNCSERTNTCHSKLSAAAWTYAGAQTQLSRLGTNMKVKYWLTVKHFSLPQRLHWVPVLVASLYPVSPWSSASSSPCTDHWTLQTAAGLGSWMAQIETGMTRIGGTGTLQTWAKQTALVLVHTVFIATIHSISQCASNKCPIYCMPLQYSNLRSALTCKGLCSHPQQACQASGLLMQWIGNYRHLKNTIHTILDVHW